MNEMIPRELAEALLHWEPNSVGIVVGELAGNFPRAVNIADVRVLGSMGSARQSATVLVSETETAQALTVRFAHQLQRAGFKAQVSEQHGGFGSRAPMQRFESDDLAITAFAKTRAQGGSCLVVSVGPPAPKEHRQFLAQQRGRLPVAPMPQLSDPPGTRNNGGSGGGSGSFAQISSELSPCISLQVAVSHYDQQLKQLGWISIGSDVNEVTAFYSYKFSDVRGEQWCSTLTIAARRDDNVMPVAFALFDLKNRSAMGSTSFSTAQTN